MNKIDRLIRILNKPIVAVVFAIPVIVYVISSAFAIFFTLMLGLSVIGAVALLTNPDIPGTTCILYLLWVCSPLALLFFTLAEKEELDIELYITIAVTELVLFLLGYGVCVRIML